MRALTLLNMRGDLTIAWEPDKDDEMEQIIEKKMQEGITFFVIEPRMEGRAAPLKTPLKDIAEARRHRALAIADEDIAKFVSSGSGDMVETPSKPMKSVRRAKSAKDAAQNETVGVKQGQGG